MTKQSSQEHLNETRTVLQTIENVWSFAQTEGKQSNLPSNIQQTITGLREYIQQCEAEQSFITEALLKSQTHSARSGGSR